MRNLLLILYAVSAVLGLVIPWYYNLHFILYSGESFSFAKFFAAGMVSDLSSSLTTDFIIGGSAAMIWMGVEGYRLGMKRLWIYYLLTFMVAFAFAFPAFLFMRELFISEKASKSNPG
jgi:hypothetical protein